MTKATIDDIDVAGRRVLLRVDFNVPLHGRRVVDDRRIREALPTINALRDRGARTIIATHMGRPKGHIDRALSVVPVADRLGELLGVDVPVAADVVGPSALATVQALLDGDVAMLENLRFEAAETSKDDATRTAFARQLAALGDLFVSDGFGVVHRKQASVYDVALLYSFRHMKPPEEKRD